MSAAPPAVHADLAFLRALVDDRPSRTTRALGLALLAGGLLYGLQCLASWAALAAPFEIPGAVWLALSAGPTIAFAVILVRILAQAPKAEPQSGAGRGVAAAFQAAGLTNLVLIAIFAPKAIGGGGLAVWLYYPAVVFALQGAVWLVAFLLRRRAWLGLVALGWFASAIAMAQQMDSLLYVVIAGAALIAFMAVPGAVLMRLSRPLEARE